MANTIDGLQVLQRLKNTDSLQNIPVVILTTSKPEQDVAKAYKYNANGYLVKSVDFEKFTSLMNESGFYRLGWNHGPRS